MLNPVQRLALLLSVFGYDLLNRFERLEVRVFTLLAFLLNVAIFSNSLPPDHILTPFVTFASAFYSVTLLLMVATWPPHKKIVHWVR